MRLTKAERATANYYGSRAEILKAGDVGSEFLREQVDGGKGGGSDDLFKNGIVNLTAQRAGYRKLGEVKYQFDVKALAALPNVPETKAAKQPRGAKKTA